MRRNMTWRGVRGVWVVLLLIIISYLLLTVARLSFIPGTSCLPADPVPSPASGDLSEAFTAFTATTRPCEGVDAFQNENPQQVERYFKARSKPVNQPVHKFLLQPRLAVCEGGQEVSLNHLGTDTVGNNARDERHGRPEGSLDLLILVPSPPQDVAVRDAIRHSWGSVVRESWPYSKRQWKVALIFLLGKTIQQAEGGERGGGAFNLTALQNEWEVNGDLLVGDFVDSYRNLTLKMLTGLHWVSSHCASQSVRHVLKADQDTFVHVDLLLHALEHLQKTQPKELMDNALIGEVLCSESVSRDPQAKLNIDPSLYPFHSYPPYVRGGTYLTPGRHVAAIVNASQYFPLLPVEDAFLNGVVARAVHLQRVELGGVMPGRPCSMSPCLFLGTKQLTATNVGVDLMRDLWSAIQAGPHYCDHNTSWWTRACQFISQWA